MNRERPSGTRLMSARRQLGSSNRSSKRTRNLLHLDSKEHSIYKGVGSVKADLGFAGRARGQGRA
jgi:hypothetical protein